MSEFSSLSQKGCVLHVCIVLVHCCLSLLQHKSKKFLVTCMWCKASVGSFFLSLPVWLTREGSIAIFPICKKLKAAFMLWWKLDEVQKHLCSGTEEFLLSQYCRLEAEEEVLQDHSCRVSSISVCLWVEENVITLGIFGSFMLHQAASLACGLTGGEE